MESTDEVAVAVVYSISVGAPRFQYEDQRGNKREATLQDFSRLPDWSQDAVIQYLQKKCLSRSVVQLKDRNRKDAMGLAVARALERLFHCRPDIAQGLERHHVKVLVSGREEVPEEFTGRAPQTLVSKRDKDWRIGAARVLARSYA